MFACLCVQTVQVKDFCDRGNVECKEWKDYRDMLSSAVPPLVIGAVMLGLVLGIRARPSKTVRFRIIGELMVVGEFILILGIILI